jgi:hypothetical protein
MFFSASSGSLPASVDMNARLAGAAGAAGVCATGAVVLEVVEDIALGGLVHPAREQRQREGGQQDGIADATSS